ncbi:cupin domain-containing protein [Hymenobacter cellulosilyticus]|uniref:Cupin domain-containing protein n=1 Tax=Hymenobacter cellulosilyticus TaxID=2932248 RepID=A0A8T9Q1I8_9BACT|nr:cupin domain-containing protein [Hymenobacter cellulosilyticus]UOQ70885.1 cupin domain-containing protein [Hymenobacter cellulosilyticus]
MKTATLSIIQERMPAGTSEVSHYHQRAHQFFFVLAGTATLVVNGVTHHLQAQQGLEVPPLTPHQLRNESAADLVFTVTSQPPSHGDRILV